LLASLADPFSPSPYQLFLKTPAFAAILPPNAGIRIAAVWESTFTWAVYRNKV